MGRCAWQRVHIAASTAAFVIAILGMGLRAGSDPAAAADAALPHVAAIGPAANCGNSTAVLRGAGLQISQSDPEVDALVIELQTADIAGFRAAYDRLAGKGAAALPALSLALFDIDPDVRSAAARLLAELGSASVTALPALVCHLLDNDSGVRENVIYAIGHTRSPSAIAHLIVGLGDPERRVRGTAARVLGDFGAAAQPAIPALVELLYEQLYFPGLHDVGSDAVKALGKIGPAAIPALVEALDRGMPRAPSALGAIGPAAVPALIEALRHPNRDMRLGAIHALGRTKPPAGAAVPALTAMLEDQDELNSQTCGCCSLRTRNFGRSGCAGPH